MTSTDLNILIQEGEGTTLEFKESLPASFAREIVALANTVGGKILLGVRDDGTVAGVRDSNVLRARIQDIARNCDPPVRLLVERVENVLIVHVRESETKPVQCGEGFFWRQGAGTQKLSRNEIRDFFRQEGAIRFDLSPCPKFRYPEDFDDRRFAAWLSLSGITGQVRAEDVLVNIEVAERTGGSLLFRNAGVLFFAKNVRHFFPQAYITCLLARGTDKVDILDRKDFDGGVVADLEDALRFVERNTRSGYRIERLERENVLEYPTKALREAITNAVMHRDWFLDGANVFVEIYGDRIEVVSPGGLPKGMAFSELGRKSVRRNALIADLLHRIGFIEKAGTGIKRIRDTVRAHGCPEPRFEANGFFTTIFRPNPAVEIPSAARIESHLHDRANYWPSTQATGEVSGDRTGEVSREVAVEATHEVTEHVARLLNVFRGDRKRQELQADLGIKHEEHFRTAYLLPALKAGLVGMTIPAKARSSKQRYRLTGRGLAVRTRLRAEHPGEQHSASQLTEEVTEEVTGEVFREVTEHVARLLRVLRGDMKRQELQAGLGIKHEEHFRTAYLLPALKEGLVAMAIPSKPRSSKQCYRLTRRGLAVRNRLAAPGPGEQRS